MLKKALKELEKISKAVGSYPDLVQGGGGNTSVKIDAELMAIKASGYRLDQITENDGFSIVNYKNIKEYFCMVNIGDRKDYEKVGATLVKQNIVELEDYKTLRPSVEAGFHSILKKYVIHTHPVYGNILCCAKDGNKLMEDIFAQSGLNCIWVPYIMPGFHLTLSIKEIIQKYIKGQGAFPQIIFMQNHGLIVTADDANECIDLHEKVNGVIKEYFKITEPYPQIQLEKQNHSQFIGKTRFTAHYIQNNVETLKFFQRVLYPDQIVYLGDDQISINGTNNRININTETGDVLYNTGYLEAKTIEETLTAYLYVIYHIDKNGLELSTMTNKDISTIKNWDAEKHRKQMIKDSKQ